jgi:hypothetical protein
MITKIANLQFADNKMIGATFMAMSYYHYPLEEAVAITDNTFLIKEIPKTKPVMGLVLMNLDAYTFVVPPSLYRPYWDFLQQIKNHGVIIKSNTCYYNKTWAKL